MKLYNTLGRKVQSFKPIEEGKVKLYTCGPTVYDYMHIGNLRKFVFDDTLRRTLEATGYQVKHVMNITDVGHLVSDDDEGEDKLEKGAAREGKTVWEVAEHYIKAFKHDAEAMNVLPPNTHLSDGDYSRATDFIPAQIEMVKLLLEKGFAYQTEQAIYFSVSKLPNYGELTGQKLSDKEVGARSDVVTDKNKQHPQDFAVWFFTTGRFAHHDMRWDSPWGEGFPGWHLECSAIVHAVLGDPIDIHTGGVDNIGTHHVNEMAQTEAAFGHKLANYWIHSEHLLVDGHRMAKSAGNFYTLKDVLAKGFQPLALRLLFLQSHYRSQMNFSWEALEAAQSNLSALLAWADSSMQPIIKTISDSDSKKLIQEVKSSLQDDLNTAKALADINEAIDSGAPSPELLKELDQLLGLDLSKRKNVDSRQTELMDRREQARAEQDWAKADELRKELTKQGIELNDTPNGPIWRRV